jgi:hypothetical protein
MQSQYMFTTALDSEITYPATISRRSWNKQCNLSRQTTRNGIIKNFMSTII